MTRLARLVLTLLLAAVVAPATLEAQQESRFVQDAQRHLALAMTRADEARQRQDYERALEPIREGLARFPESAQLHQMHGQVLTGLGQYAEAGAALRRAAELDPALEPEIAEDLFSAWAGAAQRGLDLLTEENYAEAARFLELANQLRDDRPESHLELGRAYVNLDRWAEAQTAYRRVIEIVDARLEAADLSEEDRATFPDYAATARQNLSIVMTQAGALAFEQGDFDAALNSFREAAELTPHSRDHWLNAALAAYNILEDLRDRAETAEGAALETLNRRRVEVGIFMVEATERLASFDPLFVDLYPLALAGYRAQAEAAGEAEAEALRQRMLEIVQRHQGMSFTVQDVRLTPANGSITLAGRAVFIEERPRVPTRLRFSLLNRQGEVVGSETVTIDEAAAEQVEFSATITSPPDAEVTGWKYEVVS